jgi:methylamine dehydrogenase accessory protein MauD
VSGVWTASLVVLWVFFVLLAFLVVGALRQLGLIALRLGDDPGALITDEGLDRGTAAPEFQAIDSETGDRVHSASLAARPRLLVFLSPGCLSCRELAPGLNEVADTRSGEFDFLALCRGDLESCRAFARMNRLRTRMLVDPTGAVEAAFEISVTPFAYLLDHEGRVVIRGVANDWRHLESLLEQEGTLQAGRGWTAVADGGSASA